MSRQPSRTDQHTQLRPRTGCWLSHKQCDAGKNGRLEGVLRLSAHTDGKAPVAQDLMEEIASPKYEDCWYNNLTYEHSGFRFQVRTDCLSLVGTLSTPSSRHVAGAP